MAKAGRWLAGQGQGEREGRGKTKGWLSEDNLPIS